MNGALLLSLLLLLVPSPLGDGWDFLERGKYTYARTAFSNQLRRDPEDARSMLGLGLTHLALGDPAAASAVLLDSLRLDPDQAQARQALARAFFERAQRRMAAGQRDEQARLMLIDAVDQARRSIELDAAPAEAWIVLAHGLFQLGEVDGAREAMREVQARRTGDGPSPLDRLGDEFRAVEILRGLDAASPEEYEAALAELRELALASPDSVDLRLALGDALHSGRRWLPALEAYREALAIDPFQRSCLELLLTYLPFDTLRPATVDVLEEVDARSRRDAARGDPRPGFVRYCLAQARLLEKDEATAATLFEEALELDDQLLLPCSVGMGDALMREGQHDAAAEAYLRAVRFDVYETVARIRQLDKAALVSGNLRFLSNRAMEAGATAEARDLLEAGAELLGEEPTAWNDYAFLCRETKEYERSARAYEKLLVLRPDDPRALNDAALVLHYHLQRGDEARPLYERALRAAEALLADPRSAPAAREAAQSAAKDARANLAKLDRRS